MDEHEQIITIIFSILGFIAVITLISFCIWHIRNRRRQSKNNLKKSPMTYRQQYQRSQAIPSSNIIHNKRRRKKQRRFNTNESSISFSFDPPHLINQNVKNLDKLLANESTFIYDDKQPINNLDRCYTNPTTEPIYTSSSSSNLPLVFQNSHINNIQFEFLNELNHALYIKHDERSRTPIKYSQSCRRQNDLLPFDYYRSITSTPSTINSSIENLFQSTYNRTMNYSNATLLRKARLAQLRDDTAILY